MTENIVICWFRQDLRIKDNPALHAAARHGRVLPVYILDDESAGEHKMGAASRVWLHHSLKSLSKALNDRLRCYSGDAFDIICSLVETYDVGAVYWNRCYEPWRIERDNRIKSTLSEKGVEAESFQASMLWEPWEVAKSDGTPYKVFTPFYKKGCLNAMPPRKPLAKPRDLANVQGDFDALSIDELGLLPEFDWDAGVMMNWTSGEVGAAKKLKTFLANGIDNYKEGRNFPNKNNVSRLSPHLHFGEISPNQVWHAAIDSYGKRGGTNLECFLSELGWREFSYYLLYHFPKLPKKNFQSKFDEFPWKRDNRSLRRWQRGLTGYPIVDAGMRELWQTGYMHNRVRMIVGSFLIKNLLIDWREGEAWFWDCLLDADLASNSASWQWVAGSGADAAPYFRIFNPITQGEKFDKEGSYTRRYVPELAKLDAKYLYCPWAAPDAVLNNAGITLGKTYPNPIVDVKISRERALEAFAKLKAVS